MLKQEVLSGGSALNFVSKVGTVEDVARSFDVALKTKRLDVYVSALDGLSSRCLALFSSLLSRVFNIKTCWSERFKAL